MDWKCVLLVAQVIALHITFGSEVVLQVNTKKWIYYVPERFLSLTVDPLSLAAASPLTPEAFNMAKGLSPSFVRVGGIGTNAVYFGKEFMVNSSTVSESQWGSVNDFIKRTGLDLIASLNPSARTNSGEWDSHNSKELIAYSNAKGHNVAWQLGYDLNGYNANGEQIGKDLLKLKEILDDNSKYANVPIFGPDLSSVWGAKQIRLIKDILGLAGNAMGSLILQPKFTNDLSPEDSYDLISSMANELDTYVWNKDPRIAKPIPKKPIWIAEPVASRGTFLETMKLVKRVGHSARLGVQVYLRQAGMKSLRSPTPDFWFALLYKNLVGQGVLDNKVVSQNVSGLYAFSHCTPALSQEKSVLDSELTYEKGAVTIFGVNESPSAMKLTLKATSKEEPLHIYILTPAKPDEHNHEEQETLLNGQLLTLSPSKELPVLSPRIKRPSKHTSVVIPEGCIFFVVMPESKIRTCSVPPLAPPDLNLSSLTRRLRLSPATKVENSAEQKESSEEQSGEHVYVSFAKKKKRSNAPTNSPKIDLIGKNLLETLILKLSPQKVDHQTENPTDEEIKYVAFNENSFLNKLVEGIKEELKDESAGNGDGQQKHPSPKMTSTNPQVNENGSSQSFVSAPLGQSKSESSLSRKRRSSNEDPPSDSTHGNNESIKNLKTTADSISNGDHVEKSFLKLGMAPETLSTSKDDAVNQVRNARNAMKNPAEGQSFSKKEDEGRDATGKEESEESIEEEDTVNHQNAPEDSKGHIMNPSRLSQLLSETARQNSENDPDSRSTEMNGSTDRALEPPTLSEGAEELTTRSTNYGQLHSSAIQTAEGPPALIFMQDPQIQQSLNQLQPYHQLQNAQIANNQPGQDPPFQNYVPLAKAEQSSEENSKEVSSQAHQPAMVPELISEATTQVKSMSDQQTSQPEQVPALDEEKSNPTTTATNNILDKMVKLEDEKLPDAPPGAKKSETPETATEDLEAIPLSASETIMMAPKDMQIQSENKDDRMTTLHSERPELEPDNKEDVPKVKVLRQAVTPYSATATLTAPLAESYTPKPATIVSPIKSPSTLKESSPLLARESAIKPPTVEELRERLKTMRDKMAELRLQYMAAREKRLEEIKKNVAAARSSSSSASASASAGSASVSASSAVTSVDVEEAIKSTIKRREAELKEWFKRFDKREAGSPTQLTSGESEESKSRPRRLSLFTNEEGMDLDKLLNEYPTESTNTKRSPEINAGMPFQYIQQSEHNLQKYSQPSRLNTLFGKYIFPLDVKTQGIVYNNKIYPAKLYGIVEPRAEGISGSSIDLPAEKITAQSPTMNFTVTEESNEDSMSNLEMPKSNQRVAVIPKEAFIQEIKSDYIPVVIIPPDESEGFQTYRQLPSRAKRSTLSSLEEHFHQLKEELMPKINSFIRNIKESLPWKRDLEMSSRNRRSINDILRSNDLRGIRTYFQKKENQEDPLSNVGSFVVDKIDRSEDELHKQAKTIVELAETVGNSVDALGQSKEDDTGYCEEIGTAKKSIIRDPFISNILPQEADIDSSSGENSKVSAEGGESFEEKIFASYLAEKIKSFFNAVSNIIGSNQNS